MGKFREVSVLLLAVGLPASAPSAGPVDEDSTPSLTVGVCNFSAASGRDIAEMERSATQVFQHSGIDIVWIQRAPSTGDPEPCPEHADPLGKATILVRLLNAPAEPTKQVLHQPKQTLLGRANHVTSSAMVFYTSARAIERELNSIVTKNQILGYAVAHEIGHLLLASDAHSLFGIMKENYGHQDYIAMGEAHLAFTAEESRLLRVRVLSGALRR